MFPFYIPWKHQKTSGFIVDSGYVKWVKYNSKKFEYNFSAPREIEVVS